MNYGNIWQGQCIYCPVGVIFENGQCSQKCEANQFYSNSVCNCNQGFARVGRDCVNIPNQICGNNQVFSTTLQKCICSTGCYDSNGQLNCLHCSPGSVPDLNGLSCVCTDASQFWNSNSNSCQNRCTTNQ